MFTGSVNVVLTVVYFSLNSIGLVLELPYLLCYFDNLCNYIEISRLLHVLRIF